MDQKKHRIYTMTFASVYPLYVTKAERKGRTKAEVNEVICWLTGYSQKELEDQIKAETTFEEFFEQAPGLNHARSQITGMICGVRVEEIKEPLMQKIRQLDKLIDELAKGKDMGKILRQSTDLVGEYISNFPESTQKILRKLRKIVLEVEPNAEQTISYGIPTFKIKGQYFVYFAGYKNHISLHPMSTNMGDLTEEVKPYLTGKGTAQFKLDQPIPYDLIKQLIKFKLVERKKTQER